MSELFLLFKWIYLEVFFGKKKYVLSGFENIVFYSSHIIVKSLYRIKFDQNNWYINIKQVDIYENCGSELQNTTFPLLSST